MLTGVPLGFLIESGVKSAFLFDGQSSEKVGRSEMGNIQFNAVSLM